MKKLRNVFWVAMSFALPTVALAQGGGNTPQGSGGGTTPTGSSFTLPNPLGNVKTLTDFVQLVLNNIVLPIGSIIVVIFIIYSGFLFVTARGNEEQLKTAKKVLLYVVIGTAILLGSAAIAAAIKGTLHQIAPSTI